MTLLDAHNLKLYYTTLRGIIRAVDGVSFSVEEGEALGVVGESGCGKTSLALALTRLLPRNVHTYEGFLSFKGMSLTDISEDEFRRRIRWREISMVFQGAMNSLNPVLKVGHQVVEPLLLNGLMGKREAYNKAVSLFDKVGLPREVFNRYPHELSGGMKQRIIIAMSLILDPSLVILDEPTSALDVSVQAQIMNLMKRLKRELGLSLIFITHDIALSSDLCDRLAVLYAGEIVELGGASQILITSKHPYTQMLLASIPRLKVDVRPKFISGAPPDLVNPPPGCRFHPRCPYAFEPCSRESPVAFEVGEGHTVRCWLYRVGE